MATNSDASDRTATQLQAEAGQLRKAGKLADADQLLLSVVTQDPTNFAAWFERAAIAEARQDWTAAATCFSQAATVDPNRQDVRFRQAVAAFHGRDLAQAEAAAGAHLERKPHHADTLNLMGAIFRQTGRAQAALGWFQQAIKADRKHFGAYVNAGRTRLDLGDYQQAAQSFREALKRQPKNAQVISDLAKTTHRLGNSAQALTLARQAAAADPRDATPLVNLAGILYETGRHAEALIEIERAIAINGTHIFALTTYATILVRVGSATASRSSSACSTPRRMIPGPWSASATPISRPTICAPRTPYCAER
jgi:tetratricopeptide (TPR) repeat protein